MPQPYRTEPVASATCGAPSKLPVARLVSTHDALRFGHEADDGCAAASLDSILIANPADSGQSFEVAAQCVTPLPDPPLPCTRA